jgi:two-component SAPR family response regulator
MFLLAACELEGRSVILVEDDAETAQSISASICSNGGSVAAVVPNVASAFEAMFDLDVDMVMLHVRYADNLASPIPALFRPYQVHVEFIACFDEWYDCSDGDDDYSLWLENTRA